MTDCTGASSRCLLLSLPLTGLIEAEFSFRVRFHGISAFFFLSVVALILGVTLHCVCLYLALSLALALALSSLFVSSILSSFASASSLFVLLLFHLCLFCSHTQRALMRFIHILLQHPALFYPHDCSCSYSTPFSYPTASFPFTSAARNLICIGRTDDIALSPFQLLNLFYKQALRFTILYNTNTKSSLPGLDNFSI